MSSAAVLGGGIGGLSAAYYLLQKGVPSVAVYEASHRLGGWINTEHCTKQGIRLEKGPRTIRPVGPKGQNTLKLVEELGLASSIVSVDRNHISAKNRMIYVNNQLCALPSDPLSLFKKLPPFSKPLIFSIVKDIFTGRSERPLTDETMYNFIERRFGTEMAKYLISSMICGICAGDAKRISVKFLMEEIFKNEQKHGGVIKGFLHSMFDKEKKLADAIRMASNRSALGDLAKKQRWSVYSFKDGLDVLPNTLADHLRTHNVLIHKDAECQGIRFEDGRVSLKVNGNAASMQDHLVSAIQSFKLAPLVAEQHPQLAEELQAIPYVDVAVVNIHFEEPNLLQPPAFGFLVPPSEQLPILGVIYDSCCFDQNGQTVVTVMMGGAWFESNFGTNPSNKDLYNIALNHVSAILNIKATPATGRVNVLHKCIPQYVVGHHDRVKRIRQYITKHQLPLSLCGCAYDGVGVNDVIYSAKENVETLKSVSQQ